MIMKLFNIKNLKRSSIYLTPSFPDHQTKRYKLSMPKVLGIVGLYSFFVTIVVLLILTFTPLKKYIFFIENQKLKEQADRIEELETKLTFMTKELESMASANKRLRYAIILGETDTLDSTSAIYDSLRQSEEPIPQIEGNLFGSIINLVESVFFTADDTSEQYFISPLQGAVIQEFKENEGHLGIDYGVKNGTPVVASADGYVIFSDYTVNDGNMIMVEHPKGYMTVYKHCASLLKSTRDKVVQGETIALSGNSGEHTTGPHLHFEIWKNGKPVNPENYLVDIQNFN
jgi:murein DD-endopeptidase MepM/ murein hydrolase activator NlpD